MRMSRCFTGDCDTCFHNCWKCGGGSGSGYGSRDVSESLLWTEKRVLQLESTSNEKTRASERTVAYLKSLLEDPDSFDYLVNSLARRRRGYTAACNAHLNR